MPKQWKVLSSYTIEVEGVIISAIRKGNDVNGNPRYELTRTFNQYGKWEVAKLSRAIVSYNIQEDIKKYIGL